MTFTEKDLQQLKQIGISESDVLRQIENFKNGFPFVQLEHAATIGDGIVKLESDNLAKYQAYYDNSLDKTIPIKFVPASGAASRMFKELFAFNENPTDNSPMSKMLESVGNFSFSDDLKRLNPTPSKQELADLILNEAGLNYGHLPKGLIKFHYYKDGSRTALEEHLVEGAHYSRDSENVVRIHFTVSPEHLDPIKNLVDAKKGGYESAFGVNYEISYSTQARSTNTIAVDLENTPFREPDGSLLFRPAGHGAILKNLGALDGDIIFVKNIDNVVPDRLKNTTYQYKKALGGYLLWLQSQVFDFISGIEKGNFNKVEIDEFLKTQYGIDSTSMNRESILSLLDRPMRVCGMVKNEGEPGGGPFWVRDENGTSSLQIIETSQIDLSEPSQAAIVKDATHFNPVDLVCTLKNHQGERFDLTKYVDPKTGFISAKSKDGKDLKAQELPGLWNGSMADWLTVFVEVPVITFNPVKTVNDLLRPEHQPE